MGQDYDFAEACHPDRWTVLGTRLSHLRVGHVLLLDRIESPFIVGGDVDTQDILTAVWICANTYARAAKGLYGGLSIGWKIWTWRKGLACEFKKGLRDKEAKKLEAYLKHEQRPIGIYHPIDAKKTDAPHVLLMISDLVRYTPEQVLEMPWREAHFHRERQLEKSGFTPWDSPIGEGA